MNINSFDELTDFISGEDLPYLVEYILMDDGGFCHRCSPFLMPIGTIFEHEFGTYKVISFDRKTHNIIVFCDRINLEHKNFDLLIELQKKLN